MSSRSRAGRETGQAVIVPGVAVGSALATVRSLSRHGVEPIVASADASVPARHSTHCSEAVDVPAPAADIEAYGDALLDLAERPDVVTVVPLREADVHVLSTRRAEFARHVATPWPAAEPVERVQDRLDLVETARDIGVPVPRTRPLDEWDQRGKRGVVKSRYSILVDDGAAFYPQVRYLARGESPDVERVVAEMGHVPVVQEYVDGGREQGFFALYDHGRPVATFQHERVRSGTYPGGASVYRRAVADADVDRLGRRLLDELDWHGPAMVEFRRDTDGTPVLMEINPRFWGSLTLPVVAGVNFPVLYYQLATGGVENELPAYRTGVGCHVLHGELKYLLSILRDPYDHVEAPPLLPEVAAVLGSVATAPNFDFLSLSDPAPAAWKYFGFLESALPWELPRP